MEHTLLVTTAETIAHAVVGLNPTTLPPATVLGGQRFAQAGITGVVEEDFFDWVVEVPGGEGFVRTLARRLMRFAWGGRARRDEGAVRERDRRRAASPPRRVLHPGLACGEDGG